jgi:hypothetical protein
MSWLRPIPLLIAGLTALVPRVSWVRRPVPPSRVAVETFITALAIIALIWLGWVALWLLEHRW